MSDRAGAVRIAVLGGGSGIPTVLEGLSRHAATRSAPSITAIVATADDGGSSGRLRRERGGLPPGDLRNCLLALAPRERRNRFARLFAHRYDGSGDLAGHVVGNLLLHALAEQEGSYARAVEIAGRMLGATGRVLPVSLGTLRLEAETCDGDRISGESRIGRAPAAVRRVWLDPADAEPAPGVMDAVREADLVVLGPGSLFTSLLAVLLVPGVANAVRASRGPRVLVANLMTQPGETLGMGLVDHLEALDRHVGAGVVDLVLVNDRPVDPARLIPYADESAEPLSRDRLDARPERVVSADLVTPAGQIRHDPQRLASALLAFVATDDLSVVPGDRAGVDEAPDIRGDRQVSP